jgi:hypothetical protein
VLDGPRILAVIGELIAAAMPKHVAMDEEGKACGLARASHHTLIARHGERRSTLRHENIRAGVLGAARSCFPAAAAAGRGFPSRQLDARW